MKWVAPAYTPESQPTALEGAVFLYGFNGVLRAGRNKAAAWRSCRRNMPAVKMDGGQHKSFHASASRIRPSLLQAERKALFMAEYSALTHLVRATMTISQPVLRDGALSL